MRLRKTAIAIFFLLSPIAIADEQKTFSDSKSIDLVYKKFGEVFRKRLEGTGVNPSYMVHDHDECNKTVKVGTHQPRTWSVMEIFKVNPCEGNVELIPLGKRL
tara:strand:+ start:111 stop:419 length:309 start_codon:yes stop_codon:yes gene_type:complete